jgi:antitoxin component YwqK of YwqJK toxin-antitoxin module
LEGYKRVFYKNGILKQSLEYQHGLLEGVVSTYGQDGKIVLEEHYDHGNLISHNEYGDQSAYVAKEDSAKGAIAPAPDTAPAPSDMPTKLDR